MNRLRPFLAATVALAVASSMALLPALTSATSASAAVGHTQVNAACPAGYGALFDGGAGTGYGLCYVSAFTITSGSELGLYIGAPIRNDEWTGIAPPP